MWLVDSSQVGQVAFQRMVRDGDLIALMGTGARPVDIPDSAPLRTAALAPLVRPGLTLTGLGALWAHFGGTPPTSLDVLAYEHRHWRSWSPPMPTRVHTTPLRHGAVATPGVALADALRWADLRQAIPVAYALLSSGRVAAADALGALDAIAAQDNSWRRAWSAWAAVRDAQGAPRRVTGAASPP
ncbi:MAG: hypothetical protein ACK5IM_03180 [Demequina sp.]|uniref:hypothetical protein n=1 Tax=Demequina sp. TaxID=2050685 RepID=UPI003A8A4ED9